MGGTGGGSQQKELRSRGTAKSLVQLSSSAMPLGAGDLLAFGSTLNSAVNIVSAVGKLPI